MDVQQQLDERGGGRLTGSVVKASTLSLRSDGTGPVMLTLEFSDGRVLHVVTAFGFEVANPSGPIMGYRWSPP